MLSWKQKIIFSLCVCFGILLAAPLPVQGRGLVPCGGYDPALPGGREKPCNVEHIFVLAARLTNFLIAMAGVVAVYFIIAGGFWLALSMGNEEAITKRKAQISNAVVGFILVLMAYMFVNTVVNYMLTRGFTVQKNPECRLNLTDPLTYIKVDPYDCSSIPDTEVHEPSQSAN